MKIIKRNGTEVDFNKQKIINAISKANLSVEEMSRMKAIYIEAIASDIEDEIHNRLSTVNVEEIQDMVVFALMKHAPVVATAAIGEVFH